MTITAIGTNTITLSQAATATATGVASPPPPDNFTTYDTLTSINVKGMIRAVMNGGDVARGAAIRQISDPRLAVTGGDRERSAGGLISSSARTSRVAMLWGEPRSPPSFTQIYSDEIKSFRIVTTGKTLAIRGYQALRDPTNFRRRDGNMEL